MKRLRDFLRPHDTSTPDRSGPPSARSSPDPLETAEKSILGGRTTLEVVGESFYQEALWAFVGGRVSSTDHVRKEGVALLHADQHNEHDANAISVWIEGAQVGHLSREDARRYRPGLFALEQELGHPVLLAALVVGGGMYEDGPGRLGVFLSHEPTDFGLRPPPRVRRQSKLRTGLSDAVATDDADDSYDLSWASDLPADDVGAIKKLRRLLEQEMDPIDRHFMLCHLEHALYRCREVFASALDEFDEACLRHDAEMDGICLALMTKWGSIPMLETYRQMCIRQAKAKDFAKALWWAERGLSRYADRAARPEDVEDLNKRAKSYRAKSVGPIGSATSQP
jgi:hypothetical protein